jgi:hypothetical protein
VREGMLDVGELLTWALPRVAGTMADPSHTVSAAVLPTLQACIWVRIQAADSSLSLPTCLSPATQGLAAASESACIESIGCIALQEVMLSTASVMRTVDAIAVRMKALSSPKASPLGRRLMQARVWPLGMWSSLTPILADTCMACCCVSGQEERRDCVTE